MDGFYAGYFTGISGQGQAIFAMKDGALVGADAAGVTFDGDYSLANTGEMKGLVTVKVPAGISIVQGVTAGSQGLTYKVPITLPADFANRPFITVETPMGAVNVRLVKVRDFK